MGSSGWADFWAGLAALLSMAWGVWIGYSSDPEDPDGQ